MRLHLALDLDDLPFDRDTRAIVAAARHLAGLPEGLTGAASLCRAALGDPSVAAWWGEARAAAGRHALDAAPRAREDLGVATIRALADAVGRAVRRSRLAGKNPPLPPLWTRIATGLGASVLRVPEGATLSRGDLLHGLQRVKGAVGALCRDLPFEARAALDAEDPPMPSVDLEAPGVETPPNTAIWLLDHAETRADDVARLVAELLGADPARCGVATWRAHFRGAERIASGPDPEMRPLLARARALALASAPELTFRLTPA